MTTLPDLAHEAHGGDETPKPADCGVCEADVAYFLRWGEGRPERRLSMLRCSECDTLLDGFGACAVHGMLAPEEDRWVS